MNPTIVFQVSAKTVIDNGKANSVLCEATVFGSGTPENPAVKNNLNFVLNDPALRGQLKAGASYKVTVEEV